MHPLGLLAFVTIIVVLAILGWAWASMRRRQALGNNAAQATGIGGPNDPMVGTTDNMRSADEMNASLDAAAADAKSSTPVRR